MSENEIPVKMNSYIPNTSAIPNILFDYWMLHLTPAEFKVLMCIARKTYGWHKDVDRISISQIQKMTGVSRKGIITNLESLLQNGLITKIKSKTLDGDDAPNQYEINVNCIQPEQSDLSRGSVITTLGVVNSVHQGVVYSVHPQKKTYTKETIQNNIPPLTPPISAIAESDKSDGAGVSSSSKFKKVKVSVEFSQAVEEMSIKMINIVMKQCPVYRPPDNLQKLYEQVDILLNKDKQDPDTLLRTFEWACSDNEQRGEFKGWQSVICNNKRKGKVSNPAEIFRGHFSSIYAQMSSQPKRKFSPSSKEDEHSRAKTQAWLDSAL